MSPTQGIVNPPPKDTYTPVTVGITLVISAARKELRPSGICSISDNTDSTVRTPVHSPQAKAQAHYYQQSLGASTASLSSLSRHTSGPPYSTTDLQNALPVDAGYTDWLQP